MKILFMGTPDFALVSLNALIDGGFEVAAVITQPDKPKGRGYTLTPPPVKVRALEAGIPVYQPQTLRGDEFAALLAGIAPDVITVVAYGKLLPPEVLAFPPLGCINVHSSLLPAYRGAAPIQRAIINGERVTGVTTMYMAQGLDTGDMILKAECPILPEDNFETLHDKLAVSGAALLCSTLRLIAEGKAPRSAQDDSAATHAAKIENADCALDFSRPAAELFNQIRGLSPFPLAVTTHAGKRLKLVACAYNEKSSAGRPGEVLSTANGRIKVACGSGTLEILSLLPEGKGRMSAADFINGRKIAAGDILGL